MLIALGRCEEALDSFKRAHRDQAGLCRGVLQPGQRAAQSSTATTRRCKSYDRAIALRPNYAKAHCNRGVGPRRAGPAGRRAGVLRPRAGDPAGFAGGDAQPLRRAARAQALSTKRCNASIGCWRSTRTMPKAHYMRGMLMADVNRPAEAVASYEKAVALKPDYSKARWALVHGGAADPLRRRSADRDAARRLRAAAARALRRPTRPAAFPATCPRASAWAQPFFLAYQGRNDRDLQSLFGGLATRIMAARYGDGGARAAARAGRAGPRRHRQRLLLPAFGLEGRRPRPGSRSSIRKRFQVFGYHTGFKQDGETELARQHCHRFVQGPQLARALAATSSLADRPHVLLYPEIGMYPRGGRARGAAPCAGAMQLHRPSADQRLSDHRLFPQRRTDRAARRRRTTIRKSWSGFPTSASTTSRWSLRPCR